MRHSYYKSLFPGNSSLNISNFTQKYKVNHDPEARVYPHGPLSLKKKSWVNAKNPNEARLLAVDSISDSSLKIKGKNLQEFLVDCFMSKPSRFPLILLTGICNL